MNKAIIFFLVFIWLSSLVDRAISQTRRFRPPHYLDKCVNGERQADVCFKDLPSHLMEFLQNTESLISEQEIVTQCNAYNQCMKCLEDYSAHCLQNQDLSLFNKDVAGVINFFETFCEDKNFQRDYMRYKSCFGNEKEDWITCTMDIEKALTEELNNDKGNATNKLLQFCCDYLVFEHCMNPDAKYTSLTNSSKFVCKVVKMLSTEDYVKNCPQLASTCASASNIYFALGSIVPMALILLMRYAFFYNRQHFLA